MSEDIRKDILRKRQTAAFVSLLLLFAALGCRLFYIGIFKGEDYSSVASMQRNVLTECKKVRGTIFDRNGIPFTDCRSRQVSINNRGTEFTAKSGDIFSLPILSRYDSLSFARHVIGYVDYSGHGVEGVEKAFDSTLFTNNKLYLSYTADGAGRPIRKDGLKQIGEGSEPNVGIRLTLDYHIQQITEQVMDADIPKGAVVVLDAKSFDVLAMASRPDYDRNLIGSLKASSHGELLNRCLCAYNAGSVFKIVTAAAALENNIQYKDRFFYCSGAFSPDGEKNFACHKSDGHGLEFLPEAFANSCNCAFYETGLCTGANKICMTAQSFGMGKSLLHCGLTENGGTVPQRTEYSDYETINLSIGQGEILISPLQCAVMANIIANGGVVHDVNLADCITNQDGASVQSLRYNGKWQAINYSTASVIGSMMRACVTDGTAKASANSPAQIAGKTGSAETGSFDENGVPIVHGWFCGYFPAENPRYAMAVFCENGRSGALSCVAPFTKIAEKILEIYPQ